MAGTNQQQIRQDRYPKGVLDPSLLPTPLVCTQAQVRLELPIDLLHGPSALVGTDHLSRNPLVQIGHEDFWASIMASATPFWRCATPKHLAAKSEMNSKP